MTTYRILSLRRAHCVMMMLVVTVGSSLCGSFQCARAQTLFEQKINSVTGDGPVLNPSDFFGISCTSIGDLDGDSIDDIAVGAFRDDGAGIDRGAVYILFLNADATVKSFVKIDSTTGGGALGLSDNDFFGISVTSLKDLDGAGPSSVAIAVGASDANGMGTKRGAVFVLYLNSAGGLIDFVKIDDKVLPLVNDERFGRSVAHLGDLDGPGGSDAALAVGAVGDAGMGGVRRGAAYVLFLDAAGVVSSWVKIGDLTAGGPVLVDNDQFGISTANAGDLDGGGPSTTALVVGAFEDDAGGADQGCVYVLFLDSTASVLGLQKISPVDGNGPALEDGDRFGSGAAPISDLNGDGVDDMVVGAYRRDQGGLDYGAFFILYMNVDGTVAYSEEVGDQVGGFTDPLMTSDVFGSSLAFLGDRLGDSVPDLVVGSFGDDSGGAVIDGGAVRILSLTGCHVGAVRNGATLQSNLFVNGSSEKKVAVGVGELTWGAMLLPSSGGNGKFVVHANLSSAALGTVTALPASIGTSCFPVLLSQGGSPDAVWNSIGKVDKVGASQYFDGSSIPDPGRAPEVFFQLLNGDSTHLPSGTTVTLQGVIVDPGAASPKGVATTNAVELSVQ